MDFMMNILHGEPDVYAYANANESLFVSGITSHHDDA